MASPLIVYFSIPKSTIWLIVVCPKIDKVWTSEASGERGNLDRYFKQMDLQVRQVDRSTEKQTDGQDTHKQARTDAQG